MATIIIQFKKAYADNVVQCIIEDAAEPVIKDKLLFIGYNMDIDTGETLSSSVFPMKNILRIIIQQE
jgi:hypothetical protein